MPPKNATGAALHLHNAVVDPDSQNKISEQNGRKSPLLRLPAELRNKVYAFVGDTYTLRPDHESDLRPVRMRLHRSSKSLLAICRQIQHESHPYLAAPCILGVPRLAQFTYCHRDLLRDQELNNVLTIETRLEEFFPVLYDSTTQSRIQAYSEILKRLFPKLGNLVLQQDPPSNKTPDRVLEPMRTAKRQEQMKTWAQNFFGKPNLEVMFCDEAGGGCEDRLSRALRRVNAALTIARNELHDPFRTGET